MKKILVLPVRNEEWILEKTLSCASLWADYIIVADHYSTDSTASILKHFPKVQVVKNENQFHTSNVRKTLLDAARKITGPKAIFSFDADEIPTADILDESFWEEVQRLPGGTPIEFLWINLWRSVSEYRVDGNLQSPQWKVFGFVDDNQAEYTSLNVINDHASRTPITGVPSVRFDQPKVLHFQFVDFERTMAKQAYYRMTEWIQKEHTWLSALKINLKYFPTKDERGLRLAVVPKSWFLGYEQRGVFSPTLSPTPIWQYEAAGRYFTQYGQDYFAFLDIWDIPWPGIVRSNLLRSRRIHLYIQKVLVWLLSYNNWAVRLWSRCREGRFL